jgi:hypothetical protein
MKRVSRVFVRETFIFLARMIRFLISCQGPGNIGHECGILFLNQSPHHQFRPILQSLRQIRDRACQLQDAMMARADRLSCVIAARIKL